MQKIRLATLVGAVVLMWAVAGIFIKYEKSACIGVQVLSWADYESYFSGDYIDLDSQITFEGQAAAIDKASSTIYIPQNIADGMMPSSLHGQLEIKDRRYTLKFAPDDCFENLEQAVKDGHRFKLLAADEQKRYVEYGVVFTDLPVISLNGTFLDYKSENRERYQGEISVWNSLDSDVGSYTVKNSSALWHKRGNLQDKQSWKISLKDSSGNNRNMAFVGLGEDDDWILNPLAMDDLKIREKFAMDIWQQMQSDAVYPMDMPYGEYVEVVQDGHYKGLYMLQRRVDKKYLELNENNILLKSLDWAHAQNPQQAFEIIYSGTDYTVAENLLEQLYYKSIYDRINLDNWIDVALYIQMGAMADNCYYKNMYFLFEMEDADFQVYLLPWDTDMSFGVRWNGEESVIDYSYEETVGRNYVRLEYDKLLELYPDLNTRMAQRWKYLRENVFTAENIKRCAEKCYSYLQTTGAMSRDEAVWGLRNNGEDSYENLLEYIEAHLILTDEYYEQYLK